MNRNTLLIVLAAVGVAAWLLLQKKQRDQNQPGFGSLGFIPPNRGRDSASTLINNTGTAREPLPTQFQTGTNFLNQFLQAQSLGGAIAAGGSALKSVLQGINSFRTSPASVGTPGINPNSVTDRSNRIIFDDPAVGFDIPDNDYNFGTSSPSVQLFDLPGANSGDGFFNGDGSYTV